MVKFTYWCTMGETKKKFFKISKILPTSKPFLKIEIHIEITYRWNREFFTKNDQISLDSPIVEKSKFYFPPLIRVFNLIFFFFKTKGLSMGKNQHSAYRPLRVNVDSMNRTSYSLRRRRRRENFGKENSKVLKIFNF